MYFYGIKTIIKYYIYNIKINSIMISIFYST